MKRWSVLRFKTTTVANVFVELQMDCQAWLSYNRGAMDWHPDEWPGRLYELEMSEDV